MRVVLTNFGSTGSIHPYLALAIELQRHGHQPVVALSPLFRSLVSSLGLQFCSIGPDLQQLQRDINMAMMEMPDSVEQLRALFAPLAPALPQMFDDLRRACAGADVLVSGPVQPAGLMVHEVTGLPFVTVQNVHFSSGGTLAFQEATASLINPFRRELGLSPLLDPLMNANSEQLVLFAMSRHVRQPPLNWPPHYHMTGYFFLDQQEPPPDAGLVEFLAVGDPPVVITFGSMTHDDSEALTDLLVEAIRRVGCRAIIQHGWSGLATRTLPPNIYAAGFMPHTWLFSRAACVVHHGGSGTSAAVFRAGIPSVFVTHAWDQSMWAELAQGLGCAGPAIPYPELTAERLSAAISATLASPGRKRSASALGEKIRSEPGVKMARLLIEELLRRIGLHQEEQAPVQDEMHSFMEKEAKARRRREYQKQQRLRKQE